MESGNKVLSISFSTFHNDYLQNLQSVSKGMNVQHSEERCFGSADFLILLDDMDFVEDFNRSSRNLRGDLQSLWRRKEMLNQQKRIIIDMIPVENKPPFWTWTLRQLWPNYLEERGLLWSETSVLRRDKDVDGRQGAGLGGGWLLVAKQLVADLNQVGLGKDETNVVHDVGKNLMIKGWKNVRDSI